MAVELKTIQHLCELSKLNYDEAGLEKVMGEMGDIIDLMDTIKTFDLRRYQGQQQHFPERGKRGRTAALVSDGEAALQRGKPR